MRYLYLAFLIGASLSVLNKALPALSTGYAIHLQCLEAKALWQASKK